MSPKSAAGGDTAAAASLGTLDALSDAIEAGAGLPAIARAAAQVLGASLALIDRSTAVLAVAAQSPDEEGKLLGSADGTQLIDLRVADAPIGELRYRKRGEEEPSSGLLRMVSSLLALEVERSRGPEWASDEAASDFVEAVLARKVTDRGDILARAAEAGADLEAGAGVLGGAGASAPGAGGRVALARAGGGAARIALAEPGHGGQGLLG